jgi:hypothetical protein
LWAKLEKSPLENYTFWSKLIEKMTINGAIIALMDGGKFEKRHKLILKYCKEIENEFGEIITEKSMAGQIKVANISHFFIAIILYLMGE